MSALETKIDRLLAILEPKPKPKGSSTPVGYYRQLEINRKIKKLKK